MLNRKPGALRCICGGSQTIQIRWTFIDKRQKFQFRVTSSGVFTTSKHTISVANLMELAVLFSDLPPKRVAGPVSPSLSGNGQSRPVTEHRPPAWGQLGFLK